MAQPPTSTAAIRRYYDDNTPLFLALGQPATDTIHRALWAPGVDTHAAALNHSNELVWRELHALLERDQPARPKLVDLGCGVGGSLFYLLARAGRPALALGATVSPVQARLALRRSRALGLPAAFVQADFHWPPASAGADLVYSIEAFSHAGDPARYLAAAAQLLRPGGRLILCDDFRSAPLAALDARARRWLAAYQAGWHIPQLQSAAEAAAAAEARGLHLVSARDLTGLIRLRALPDRAAEAVLTLAQPMLAGPAYLAGAVGSLALQQCLRAGWVGYHFLVFERAP